VERRRARIAGLPCTLTHEQWHETVECFDGRCAYCGKIENNPEQEHVTPVSAGGGYTQDNIVPACRACNRKKAHRGPLFMVNRPYAHD
jgi:5-methylcytosine-specific restriction endonuclease McrA